jgi:hypothetical protein
MNRKSVSRPFPYLANKSAVFSFSERPAFLQQTACSPITRLPGGCGTAAFQSAVDVESEFFHRITCKSTHIHHKNESPTPIVPYVAMPYASNDVTV